MDSVELVNIDTFSESVIEAIAEEEVEMTSQATMASITDSEKVSIFTNYYDHLPSVNYCS